MQISRSFHTIAPTITVRRSTESVTMATMKFSARRLIIAGGFAVAVAAAPAIAFVATPAASTGSLACTGGEEPDLYTSLCVPHLVPNAGQPYSAIGGNPDLPAVNLPGGGGSIPCTGHNSGQCIGLSEEQQAPVVTPESTIGSSPTVTGFDDNAG
jgi:hypothetical protein